MARRKILYIVHNHSSLRPGGTERYASELYEAMRSSADFEPILLARGYERPHHGTLFGTLGADSNQYLFYSDPATYNWFLGTSPDKRQYTRDLHEFLTAFRPALVHVQHTMGIGLDVLRQIRNSLPGTPIIYTLHDFGHICHRQGQMVRVQDQQLCREESPQHCHQCFPKIPAADFFLRKRFTEYHLSLVDMFVAPSRFLCERYLEWGIPAEKIRVEEYGRLEARQAAPVCRPGPKNRFGFFGQCTMFKGVDVLLKAMKLVAEEEEQRHVPPAQNSIAESGINGHAAAPAPRLHLTIHAANLELQPQTFQKEIKALVEACQRNVTWIGRYEHADLPELMANIDWVVVPSIWWENSPLVIQEAFQHGKPVICSNVGGMAEKVADGVNGLHFRVADSASLAHTLLTAAGSPELWHKLREGIPPVYRMDEHFAVMTRMYQELLDRHSGNHVQPCRG